MKNKLIDRNLGFKILCNYEQFEIKIMAEIRMSNYSLKKFL